MAFGGPPKPKVPPPGAAIAHFELAPKPAPHPGLARPLEERWCDLFEAFAAAVKRQHELNLRLYPKHGKPLKWDQPAPPEKDVYEATISLVCFLEGLMEHYVRVKHGHYEVMRWVHGVCATAASNVHNAVEMRAPNPSGFPDVPFEIVAARELLADLFAKVPLDPFRPLELGEGFRIDPERLREATWKKLLDVYDQLGKSAFGSKREWLARGRTEWLREAYLRGIPDKSAAR